MPVQKNIGITHVFSCIYICRVLKKLFEQEANRSIIILAYFTLFQQNLH